MKKHTLTSILATFLVAFSIVGSNAVHAQFSPNLTDNPKGLAYAGQVRPITASYSARIEDHTILANATSAALTVTLPASPKRYHVIVVKKTDSSANAVTVDGYQSETIDGATTLVLTGQYQSVTLHYYSGQWYVLNPADLRNEARTATAAGLTTGQISEFATHVTVTSANADHIIVLPKPVVGKRITIDVGSTGFELRTTAPATIGINGGTGSDAESAIAANSTLDAVCISLTAWKVVFWDADGDVAKVTAAAP